jgi:hypothetical protein
LTGLKGIDLFAGLPAQIIGELAHPGVVERRNRNLIVHDWSKLPVLTRTDAREPTQ